MTAVSSSVCAIVPTYNRAHLLRECIDSILAQSRPVQEVLVINDGSTDDTESVAKSYGGIVRVLTKPNGGKASAVNFAFHNCTTDYVWVCDDDDIAAPDGVKHLVTALDANEAAGLAYGTFMIFRDGDAGRSYTPPTYWMREGEPSAFIQFLEEMFTFQHAMLVRRSLYDTVGPFREDLPRSEDVDMVLRLTRVAKPIYVPHVIFFQRAHDGPRGRAADLFPAELNAKKWLESEQMIFASLRKQYSLDEFTPTFARGWEQTLAKRAALIERACVYAERALWNEAIDDFQQACTLSPAPATSEELRLAEAVIRKYLPWDILGSNPDWIGRLCGIYKANEYGRAIIYSVCRPLVWQARQMFQRGDFLGGVRRTKTLASILGIRGAISRVHASVF